MFSRRPGPEQRGARLASSRRLRAFELTVPTQAPLVPGEFRLAGPVDLPIVEAWYRASRRRRTARSASAGRPNWGRERYAQDRVFLWDDNGPVTQAAIVGITPRGVRIGMVYTPPERRRHGYADCPRRALSQRSSPTAARSAACSPTSQTLCRTRSTQRSATAESRTSRRSTSRRPYKPQRASIGR